MAGILCGLSCDRTSHHTPCVISAARDWHTFVPLPAFVCTHSRFDSDPRLTCSETFLFNSLALRIGMPSVTIAGRISLLDGLGSDDVRWMAARKSIECGRGGRLLICSMKTIGFRKPTSGCSEFRRIG